MTWRQAQEGHVAPAVNRVEIGSPAPLLGGQAHADAAAQAAELGEVGQTAAMVRVDGAVAALPALADRIRPAAASVVARITEVTSASPVLERTGLAVEAQLDRVRERFAPGEAALTAVLACKALGSESRTRMLVHAFTHFWAGEDDAAIHLALPRVEALLRQIERDRGVPVVSVPQGKTPGGVTQLGGLISAMPAGTRRRTARGFGSGPGTAADP